MQLRIKLCLNVTCKSGINIIINTILCNNLYLINLHLKSERHTKSTNSYEPKQSDIRGLFEPQTSSRFDQQFCKS